MKIVIIEDERLSAEDLVDIIKNYDSHITVVAILGSVKEAVAFLKTEPSVDLIFSDIQLGDGICFDIYEEVKINVPVIFCTAYDQYALDAFKSNGIDYVLKPFTNTSICNALNKYKSLQKAMSNNSFSPIEDMLRMFDNKAGNKNASLLVHFQDKIIPVKHNDIALFYIKNDVTHLHTFDNKIFSINKSLDELDHILSSDFYRANRQYIVNRNAIKDASSYQSRKTALSLNVNSPEVITISKEKLSSFLNWLSAS